MSLAAQTVPATPDPSELNGDNASVRSRSSDTNAIAARYTYPIFLLFALADVLLFKAPVAIQATSAILEYAFLIVCFVFNRKLGCVFLVSFTLLSAGAWSFAAADTLPPTFWGLHLSGISVNILMTFVACGLWAFPRPEMYVARPHTRWFTLFIFYSLLIGMFSVILSANYVDNFFRDALVYLPYLAYVPLLTLIDDELLRSIIVQCISVTVISMLVSRVTGNLFSYGGPFRFVIMNGFAYVAVFAILFMRRFYSLPHYIFLLLSVVFLLATNSIFLGVKGIIALGGVLLWAGVRSKRAFAITLAMIFALVLFQQPILAAATGALGSLPPLAAYKAAQVLKLFHFQEVSLPTVALSSSDNVLAEASTMLSYMMRHPFVLFFGKGFGGGIPDISGQLSPFTGRGAGYSPIDALRDDYVRMHLPFFEIVIKSGLVGALGYIWLALRAIRGKSIWSFAGFFVLVSIFSNTKETILLTLLFLTLAAREAEMESNSPNESQIFPEESHHFGEFAG